jgi:16S rRNA (cytosine967-C5)-methyltransferase
MRRLASGLRGLVASLPDGPVKESYPDWIAEVWTRDFGAEMALELMRAQNEPPALEVRSGAPVGTPTDVPGAYAVERVDPRRMRPMSRASQLAAIVVGAREGERILDACAAPGGKSSILAERAEVTAVEIHPGRATALAAQRLPRVEVVNADLRELATGGFDRALVDAPCSGLGVLARRPDLRWRAQPLPELQAELLAAAAERVKPGGLVVYAVCTLNADENEAVVDASGLEVVPLDDWPQYAHPRRPEFLLTLPHRDHTSGFFIARLRRPFS